MSWTFLAVLHGNRSKRGYGSINSRWYGERVLRFLHDLVWQLEFGDNNNVFFVHSSGFAGLICFWKFSGLCMMVQRFLVPTFMDKNFNGCLQNTLAACCAFASEFGTLMVQLRCPGCAWCFWQLVWLVFQQQPETNLFSQTAFAFFLEAACRFTTTSWTRRMFLEFVRSLRCFWGVWGEFNACEFTPMEMDNSLNVDGWEFVFRFPLPLPRRQSWNKSDATQRMLHVKQTTLSFRFPVWKRVERLVQWELLFWGFVFWFKHSTWRRPTPLRLRATSCCN